MPQAFRRRTELAVKLVLLSLFLLALFAFLALVWQARDPGHLGVPVAQPIPFSHKHHVGDVGIDCRYCHTTVQTEAHAGLPSTHICLSCHSQLFKDAPLLALLHDSEASGRPVAWRRIHTLPDFVYFDHSVHVGHGVACLECHGRVDQMPLTWQVAPLQMQWCLGCHRNPAPHLHPPGDVFRMDLQPLAEQDLRTLVRSLHLPGERRLTDCSTCHR